MENDLARQFAERGYARLQGAAAPEAMDLMFEATLLNRAHEGYLQYDKGTNAWGRYCDAMSEALLLKLKPQIEAITGTALAPAYSYLRVYTPESRLHKHRDRPSCELSATLTIGQDDTGLDDWPVWVEVGGEEIAVPLRQGDLMVYRGAEIVHWREPLPRGLWVQAFLHYVDPKGPYRAFATDGRERVGPVDLPVNRPHGINLPQREKMKPLPPIDSAPADVLEVGRNEPCPCNSGKRYKHCHGAVG